MEQGDKDIDDFWERILPGCYTTVGKPKDNPKQKSNKNTGREGKEEPER